MNLNDVGKIGKILKESQEVSKNKQPQKTDKDFEKILEEEISQTTSKTDGTLNVIPSKQLLNVKNTSIENIFIKKGLEQLVEFTKNLEKFGKILNSKNFDLNSANEIVKLLRDNLNLLNTIKENINNPEIKNELNKAIVIGNVEVEKYLRGDYFS